MDTSVSYAVNCGFGWFIVLLSIIGYLLTAKKVGEKWPFWNVLAIGWAFYAIVQTLLLTGTSVGTSYLVAIWLSSYILVIASMVLLFIRLTRVKS
jgi:hypothetical protein